MWNDFLNDVKESGILCLFDEDAKCFDTAMQSENMCNTCFLAWKADRGL